MAKRNRESDGNPGYLPPEPKVKVSNKKILTAVIAVITVMLVVLMLSMSSEDKKKAEEERDAPPLETENKPLTSPVEGFGLAFEKEVPPPPKNDEEERVVTVGPPPVDREAEARLREAEETRRRQFAAEQNAYGAPMLVKREMNTQAAAPEYAAERPSAAAPYVPAPGGPDAYDPAAARDREGFLARAENSQWRLPYTREAGHDYELKTGAVIGGVMVGGINSDLPGSIIGQVSQNVYDTASGRALLIPRGSKIYGVYDSRVVYGQSRLLIAWNRLIFPDGSSLTLGAMPGADVSGYAGFADQADNHYFRIFGSAVLMSLIGGGMSYAVDSVSGNNNTDSESGETTMQDEMTSALAAQLGQTTLQLLQKNLSISPTLKIRPGYQFNVMVTKDMVFGGPYAAR